MKTLTTFLAIGATALEQIYMLANLSTTKRNDVILCRNTRCQEIWNTIAETVAGD